MPERRIPGSSAALAARPVIAALALAAGLALAGCSDRASGTPARQGKPAPAVPVTVAEVAQERVPVEITAVGNVQAYTTVSVKSLISGQIVQAHFKEGQEVKQHDPLFTIDPRSFEATLRQAEANVARDTAQARQAEAALGQRHAEVQQAEANLARDTAQLDNARVQERRYRELVQKELVAREQYDQVKTTASAIEATVAADRAAIENARAAVAAGRATLENARAVIRADEAMVDAARVQLGYTLSRSPMNGRTGNLLVQSGNVVKANDDNPLVVITQVHPIYVSFAVPEQHLANIKKYRAAGNLRVSAQPRDASQPTTGELTFVNNTVDATTGTIQLKATFTNDDNALWPGQFADVSLTLTSIDAVTVPSQAVQAGQQGPFVFVVKPDQTVESRQVGVGRRLARTTIIERGLRPGERVVTDGQLRLVPGAKVEIKPQRS
ncbi:MAG: efflux RND transporter periplasmic adaptor subunit [Candidatus Rokubacteria bacterium]|nr:efflux RND transporter periplasmic adaptor subunit [Candidatus Rokubacteria bacterium]